MRYRLAIVLLALAGAARAGENTVEQTRKNIRVLQGLPESQLFMAMNSVAQSLGVHCDYCHVKSGEKWIWESDEKRTKPLARDTGVVNVPPLPPRTAPALPSAAEIVKRYLAAVGGANGIERIGDRDVYALGVRNKTCFFDVQTALLRRELSVTETLLAPLPQQVDYNEYRDVDGAKRAFFIRTSDAAP